MWTKEFEAIRTFVDKYQVDLSGPVLEVGGGPVVVLDNKPQCNPMLDLVPHVEFLDYGFIQKYRELE